MNVNLMFIFYTFLDTILFLSSTLDWLLVAFYTLYSVKCVWDIRPSMNLKLKPTHFFANSFDNQSSPSYNPWPCVAHVA